MPTGRVRPAVLTILIASLLLLADSVSASGADPKPPPCKTAAEFDPANFPNPPKIDNQWNPLAPGMQFILAREANQAKGLHPDRVVSTVTDLTKVVNGVTAVVVLKTHITAGVVEASELAFQAQDNAGNLWNLGAFPAEFKDDGKFKGAPDAWISGESHAEPGNLMLGDPQLETPEYLQGWSPDIDFLGCAKVYKMQQKTCVPAGCYDNVLITEEWSPLEPRSGHQRTYYAPEVGIVRVAAAGNPQDEALVLTEVSQLSPEDLAKVRQEALELEKTAYEASAVYRQTSPTELTTEPQPEPPSPEPPQPPTTRPSIKIANAPIGGDDDEGPEGCVKVNWLGTKPIPDGITIKLGSIHLDPKGIFELDQDSCSGNEAPSCAGLVWKGGDPPGCYVGAKQVAFVDTNKEDVEVHVIVAVAVTCKHRADCNSLAADPKNRDGSSVGFTPAANFGKPSEEQSEPPSEEQSKPPSEEQSKPPSDEQSEAPSDEQSEAPSESPSNG
jgi:hypothetical protein